MSPPHNQLTGPSFLPRPTKGPQPRESGRQLCKLLTEGETHNVVVSHKEKEERGGSKWRLVKNEIKKDYNRWKCVIRLIRMRDPKFWK